MSFFNGLKFILIFFTAIAGLSFFPQKTSALICPAGQSPEEVEQRCQEQQAASEKRNGPCSNKSGAEFGKCIKSRIAIECTKQKNQALTACQSDPQPVAAAPAAQIAQPEAGGCQRDGECWDSNFCTEDVCDNGVCKNPTKAAGTICELDENTGSPYLACSSSARCNQRIISSGTVDAPPLPVQAPAPPVIQPPPGPVQTAPRPPFDPIFGPYNPPSVRTVPDTVPPDETEDIGPVTQPGEPQEEPQIPGQAPKRSTVPRTPRVPSGSVDSPNPPSCPFGGQNFTPGQKRYECFEPRQQGTCDANAGYGIPLICNNSGDWSVGNNGFGECTTLCVASSDSTPIPDQPPQPPGQPGSQTVPGQAVRPPGIDSPIAPADQQLPPQPGSPAQEETVNPPGTDVPYTPARRTPPVAQIPGLRPSQAASQPAPESCPQSGDTCIYSVEGGQCYSGTGAYGFNAPKCVYSCGPVECPVISQEPPEQQAPNESCFGEIYSSCGSDADSNMIMTSWYITNKLGKGTCNVFIKDELGDHVISNDCSGVWSGTEVPGGTKITQDGTYQLFVSNGTDSCFNQQAGSIQLTCNQGNGQKVSPEQSSDGGDQGIFEPVVDWFSGWWNTDFEIPIGE